MDSIRQRFSGLNQRKTLDGSRLTEGWLSIMANTSSTQGLRGQVVVKKKGTKKGK